MQTVYMFRDEVAADCIRSIMVAGGAEFHVLERPWLDNRRNISCIPAGEYLVKYLARSASGKYRNCYYLQDVTGRTGILIHNGNLVAHTRGCLINGKRRGRLAKQKAVLNSKTAMRQLVGAVGKNDFKLKIIGGQRCLQNYSVAA